MTDVEIEIFHYGFISAMAFCIVSYLVAMTVYGVIKLAEEKPIAKDKSL